MTLLSSTEIQECGHPANFCHECEGDLNTCGFNGDTHSVVTIRDTGDGPEFNESIAGILVGELGDFTDVEVTAEQVASASRVMGGSDFGVCALEIGDNLYLVQSIDLEFV